MLGHGIRTQNGLVLLDKIKFFHLYYMCVHISRYVEASIGDIFGVEELKVRKLGLNALDIVHKVVHDRVLHGEGRRDMRGRVRRLFLRRRELEHVIWTEFVDDGVRPRE